MFLYQPGFQMAAVVEAAAPYSGGLQTQAQGSEESFVAVDAKTKKMIPSQAFVP